ncbi:MAG: hypothetical protein A2521_17080 [Deltaproteobacteria bacterium RIFOXYD12_FULL_57_12]|nr:MAG: hypothetical protein A2521_17080 [Deltaproteobacteria bacterium RIFOXYD12_FULL_57_12]
MSDGISESEEDGYCGRILHGNFSPELRQRLAECLAAFQVFDRIGAPVIPYISAWRQDEHIIWYEYAGRRFTEMFGCRGPQLAEVFREAVIDHRIFQRNKAEAAIQEQILSRHELSGVRNGLRAEVMESGTVEAVYKVALPGGAVCWLKDRARVETFADDRLYLSVGLLIEVSNEMAQKDLLERIGYFDNLTNLPNRNIMQRSIEVKTAQFNRGHITDFTFLMLDLDHFKAVNDTYGHQAGDQVLATVAEVMGVAKRREDEIGRYGGEEFYGLALGSIAIGRDFAERLRQRVATTVVVHEGQEIVVTMSIGLVAASELAVLNIDALIAAADRRLYKAKHDGRNRVCWRDE